MKLIAVELPWSFLSVAINILPDRSIHHIDIYLQKLSYRLIYMQKLARLATSSTVKVLTITLLTYYWQVVEKNKFLTAFILGILATFLIIFQSWTKTNSGLKSTADSWLCSSSLPFSALTSTSADCWTESSSYVFCFNWSFHFHCSRYKLQLQYAAACLKIKQWLQ